MDSNVDIIPMFAGADGKYVNLAIESGVSGIVVQGLGLGNVNDHLYQAIKKAIEKGIIVVISTRVSHGHVSRDMSLRAEGRT
jgi:L-asparaginase